MITVAVNGFGRIGRNFVRAVLLDPQAVKNITIAVINIGPAKPEFIAHMFRYDTLMGLFPGTIELKKNKLIINDHEIEIISELDPKAIHWDRYAIDWVVESSGAFSKQGKARVHLESGAKHVLITAPSEGEDVSIIPGVNESDYKPTDKIVSLGSCTTNAFIPTLKVLQDAFGIIQGFMTTIHAYTNTQVLLDVEDGDLRKSRAAALNIIPTSTGASKMLSKVLPELAGKIQAMAIRVPVAKVSLIDLTFTAKQLLTKEMINASFIAASQSKAMNGIIGYTDLPLVSSDYSADSRSVIIDGLLTEANESMGTVFGWYDNEWAYSMRLKDFLLYVNA
ncbi:MAG TPA: glyceraldehyde 3-phosphate dehydrogenase NAD-binding domain-containing protein [Candidatus Babeliales bacterium]|nr:glyceraldehyde 3-phosphate dehydrogenase NAD-binding domain-containing protein [Candidatus Babeliales bacterium]